MKFCQSSVKRQRLRITSTDASFCKYALRAKWISGPDLSRILWRRVADVYVMEKTSPFSRIMPVCSAVRLNEAAYVSPTQLCWRISSQWSPNVPAQAATPWEHYRLSGGLHFIIVYMSVPTSVFETPIYTCINTHIQRLDNSELWKRPHARSLHRKERRGARRGLPTVSAPSIRPRHAFASDPFHEICSRDVGFLFIFCTFFLWKALYPEGMDLQDCFDPSFMILLFVLATSPLKAALGEMCFELGVWGSGPCSIFTPPQEAMWWAGVQLIAMLDWYIYIYIYKS